MSSDLMCPPIFSGKSVTCIKEQCSLWDNDRNKCLLKLFLAGYLKRELETQKIMSLYDKIQDKLEKDEDF